jgi:glycosyltransferase involved in cell wall biosynthesis
MPHKRIELAVRAFNALRRPLVVIGDGPDAKRLQRLAGPSVRFTGRVSDGEVARLLATSRALVVTATEEFGIAAVEAQAAGRPVVALDEGGVTESVQEGRTGFFYDEPTPEALADAIAAFDPLSVDPADCVANAQRFSRAAFAAEIRANVEQALAAGPSPRGERRRPARGLALAGRRAA